MPDRVTYADGSGRDPELPEYPGMPRWVKLFVLIAVSMLLVLVILMFVGGEHGPGRHMPSQERGVQQP